MRRDAIARPARLQGSGEAMIQLSEVVTPAPDSPETGNNPGTALNIDWVQGVQVNRSAVERRTASLPGRRSIKKEWQAAWLLRTVTLIDLTTLAGDDTEGRVRRLIAKARQPVRQDLLEALGMASHPVSVAAICVYHEFISCCADALADSGIKVAAVSTGFPAGQSPYGLRLAEIGESVGAGADEIDIVISRRHVLAGDWKALYDEVREFRSACEGRCLKTILATGELGTLRNVARASLVCMMAGADFVKTSTGKERVNATLPVSLTMMRTIRDYHQKTGHRVGFKPAGGISRAKDALVYLSLVKEELGNAWISPEYFRFGASSLLADIERQLEHHVTGSYSVGHNHPAS